jgi:uncharacterized protein (TIGR02611 family)
MTGDVLVWVGRNARRMAVALVGSALLVLGLVLLALPGPGLLVIIAGLAVLGTEFAWAKRALSRTKANAVRAGKAAQRLRPSRSPR